MRYEGGGIGHVTQKRPSDHYASAPGTSATTDAPQPALTSSPSVSMLIDEPTTMTVDDPDEDMPSEAELEADPDIASSCEEDEQLDRDLINPSYESD